MSEPILYADKYVTVTPSLVIAGKEIYAVANLTSVSVAKLPTSRALGWIVLMASMAVCALASRLDGTSVLLLVGIGLVLAVASLGLFFVAKPSYAIQVVTASGQVRMLGAVDREHSDGRYQAIYRAIMEHNAKSTLNIQV